MVTTKEIPMENTKKRSRKEPRHATLKKSIKYEGSRKGKEE